MRLQELGRALGRHQHPRHARAAAAGPSHRRSRRHRLAARAPASSSSGRHGRRPGRRVVVVAADVVVGVDVQVWQPPAHRLRLLALAAAAGVRGLGGGGGGATVVGDPRPHAPPQLAGGLGEAPEAHGQRHGRRVEDVALHEDALLGERLPHLQREPGAQRVAADAHAPGAEPARGGAQRGERAGEADGALEAVPREEPEVVGDVAAERGRPEERAPQRHDGGGRAGGAEGDVVAERGLAVPLEHGAVDGAVALVDERLGEPVLEGAPPLRRQGAGALVAPLLPVELQQVDALDEARDHHSPVVGVLPACAAQRQQREKPL
uniref:Uncharacterized protein n=1 Tax=Oryza nivara TaxID=4536 RepID=A0A0E0FQN4_ORYNI